MTLYIGNKKIQDEGVYGVYYGEYPIQSIYYGSNLVYDVYLDPYVPGTELLNESTGGTYTANLKMGRYYIALTGAGGQTSGGYYYICGKNLGSSGGTIAGDFRVDQDCTVSVTIGVSSGGKSYLVVDNVEMMTANGGNTCHSINDCGNHGGGTASFSLSGKLSNRTLQAITGNDGYYTTGNTSTGIASNDPISTSRGQGGRAGDCNVFAGNPGGVYIKYVSVN